MNVFKVRSFVASAGMMSTETPSSPQGSRQPSQERCLFQGLLLRSLRLREGEGLAQAFGS